MKILKKNSVKKVGKIVKKQLQKNKNKNKKRKNNLKTIQKK